MLRNYLLDLSWALHHNIWIIVFTSAVIAIMYSYKKGQQYPLPCKLFRLAALLFAISLIAANISRIGFQWWSPKTCGRMYTAVCFFASVVTFFSYSWFSKQLGISKISSKKRIFLIFACAIPSIMSSFGTACFPWYVISHSVGIFSIPIIVFVYDVTKAFEINNFYSLLLPATSFLCIFPFIIRNHIYRYENCLKITQNKVQSKNSIYLKGVSIDKDNRKCIDKLISSLHKKEFDFQRDRLFVFPYIAGMAALSGAKSFGCSFQCSSPDEKTRTEFGILDSLFIDLEPKKNIRYVYILSANVPMGKNLHEKLFSSIKPCSKTMATSIGKCINYHLRKENFLKLYGPYIPTNSSNEASN
ncbi:hypothetical protein [Candidatus Hydrogenosomobacter endosymbioticus]|uniref:hypothetical protein n=1 Tax=Candidatus Hydrogenosomobacter endosymbioticus TaxID=2558174 RepID=UPI001F3D35CF|nr:hypothetical protein [Candidatus Hydrogenosomobacter endosymbioticus]